MRRRRKHESQRRQAAATAIAKERREAMLREEYNKLVRIFSSGRHYSFDEFMALEKRLTDPFQCDVDIDGEQMRAFANHHEAGAFNLVLHRTITDELFSSKRSRSNDDDDGARKRQKRSNGGRRQPPTRNSEDGISAAEFLVNFDRNKGISDAESNKKTLEREKRSLLTFHEKIVKFKEKNSDSYFTVPDGKVKNHIQLMYRLFGGTGYTTKSIDDMTNYLKKQVVVQATTDAKIEGIRIRLAEIQAQLQQMTNELETERNVSTDDELPGVGSRTQEQSETEDAMEEEDEDFLLAEVQDLDGCENDIEAE
jgi:hypothetical protein